MPKFPVYYTLAYTKFQIFCPNIIFDEIYLLYHIFENFQLFNDFYRLINYENKKLIQLFTYTFFLI